MKPRFLSVICSLASVSLLSSCATQPKTYQPPDASRLKASTHKVSTEVDAAHASARKAQTAISAARQRQKEIAAEVKKLKNVPASLVDKIEQQDATLEDAASNQASVEAHLTEADKAKAQVEKDKTDYFDKAQGLADAATNERNARIKNEKALSWYRWHWWLSWIIAGAGVVVCILIAILKFTGRLALKMPLLL